MSTFSLPRLLNGGGLSRNCMVNTKYATLNKCCDISKRCEMEILRRRPPLDRHGTIRRNQFRGVKRDFMERQSTVLAHSMTIDELYEEVLYEILNNVGCEVEVENCQGGLFEYVQDAFKISNEKHAELLDSAEKKEPPELRLNVEIMEAKDLQAKDSNGLSDPFVTMYIASNPTHRYNTSVKAATLNPRWEEHFSLPIAENANDENLVVEVWDFDPAESINEKMSKIFDVKGIKGLRKLMKEIAVTATTGNHDNELIGRANIALKTIPASGIIMWFTLDKKNKTKRQGLIKIRMNFSAEKNSKVAAQEHRHLLRILLMHELETSKVAHYWWSGKFSAQGEAIITQHSAQSGLCPNDCAMAQWAVYAAIHTDHPLAFALFDCLLDKIMRPLQQGNLSDDDVKLFWEASKKLLPSCFGVIRKIRKKTAGDKNCVKILSEVLSILSKIATIEPPEGTDLFPRSLYGWIQREDEEPNCDIQGALNDAVYSGAEDWFHHINESADIEHASDEEKLQHLIKIIQLVRSDLQRAIEYYDKHFQTKMKFHYARVCFNYYQKKISELCQPIIQDVSKNIKRIQLPEDRFQRLPEYSEINMGTTLFELYLVLKRFIVLGTALDPGAGDNDIDKYHLWFNEGVSHWLDISVFKALTRIEKAIELDKLVPLDDSVKYTSSAVDTLAIFHQIKIFWQQLAWPDVEGAYMFVGKIVDDICRCCVFYADRMSEKMEGLGDVKNIYETKFEVTQEWCLAINNIDYIRQSLPPFVKELGTDDIITKMAECKTQMEAERCAETLKNVVDNAIDTEHNKIMELIEVVSRKMSPPMRRFLTEGAELLHQDSNSMDRLMMYLEDSLATLHSELNELNFDRILEAIWNELAVIIHELVRSNIDKRRPPSFFANLRDTLQVMVKAFKKAQSEDTPTTDKETLDDCWKLLEVHGFETSDLIHQYYKDRVREQEAMTEHPYGILTVRCHFEGNTLHIEVMNAKHLLPMDSNGKCDPFVRIHFIPEEKYTGISKPKTNTQSKTVFPLFDEKFSISLTPEQKNHPNALIVFSVKDKDYFGMSNQYIAEAYVLFSDVPETSDDLEQIHLRLSRPANFDTDCVRALENRQGDKQAKEFIKKLRQKANGTY